MQKNKNIALIVKNCFLRESIELYLKSIAKMDSVYSFESIDGFVNKHLDNPVNVIICDILTEKCIYNNQIIDRIVRKTEKRIAIISNDDMYENNNTYRHFFTDYIDKDFLYDALKKIV